MTDEPTTHYDRNDAPLGEITRIPMLVPKKGFEKRVAELNRLIIGMPLYGCPVSEEGEKMLDDAYAELQTMYEVKLFNIKEQRFEND